MRINAFQNRKLYPHTAKREMKKLFVLFISALLCLGFVISAFAEAESEEPSAEEAEQSTVAETTQDASNPRLMIIGYELDKDSLMPEQSAKLKITFKNYSNTKAVSNIKLSLADSSGDISVNGIASSYASVIYAGGIYVWSLELTAAKTAAVGMHDLQITAEYEDKYFGSYSSTDTVRIPVKQTVGLVYDGISLPAACTQGETVTISSSFMNSGKSLIRNLTIACDIKGLSSGGSTFVGEIEPGQSATANTNLRAATDITGEVSGTVTLTYEDEFGEKFTKTVKLSTVLKEKVETSSSDEVEEEEESKNGRWWLFLIIGTLLGGGAGFGIEWAIVSKKQREEDEKRL